MKALVRLVEPVEEHVVEIDAWARLMFERNATKHGLPPGPMRDMAARFPESYVAICAYYALKRRGIVDGEYEAFESRWNGVEIDDGEREAIADPTTAGR